MENRSFDIFDREYPLVIYEKRSKAVSQRKKDSSTIYNLRLTVTNGHMRPKSNAIERKAKNKLAKQAKRKNRK